MKRFAFRFDRLLTLRRAEEQRKLLALAEELARLEAEAERLKVFENERVKQLEEMNLAASKPFPVWARGCDWKYLGRLGRVTDFQQARVEEQKSATERARATYVESHAGVKSLERLREKKKLVWWGEELEREQKALDDLPPAANQTEKE